MKICDPSEIIKNSKNGARALNQTWAAFQHVALYTV